MTEPSDPHEGDDGAGERHLPVPAGQSEPLRGELVEASSGSTLERLSSGPLAGPAMAAGGGFLVGFVTFVTARLLRGSAGRRLFARRRRRSLERQIESSRSFLVDVHMLRR